MSKAKGKGKEIPVPAGDTDKGKKIYESQCSVCQAIEKEDNKNAAAPSLGGVRRRDAGKGTTFPYSNAFKKTKRGWNESNMFQYLKAPGKFIPGNKMSYSGIADDQDRADVVAYLKSIS